MKQPKHIGGWKAFFLIAPIALAAFPVPLAFPVVVAGLLSVHIENWPVVVVYFSWLIAALIIVWRIERRGGTVG